MKKVKPQQQQHKAVFLEPQYLGCEGISGNFQEYEIPAKTESFIFVVFLSFPSCKCTTDKHHSSSQSNAGAFLVSSVGSRKQVGGPCGKDARSGKEREGYALRSEYRFLKRQVSPYCFP